MGKSHNLNKKQLETIKHLVQGRKYEEIAKLVGISTGAITQWRKREEFEKEYESQKRQLYNQYWNSVNYRINELSNKAIDCLEELIEDKESKDYVRCNASLGLLDFLCKVKQMDIENRIQDLEEKLENAIAFIETQEDRKADSTALTPEEVDRIRSQILGMAE